MKSIVSYGFFGIFNYACIMTMNIGESFDRIESHIILEFRVCSGINGTFNVRNRALKNNSIEIL